MKENTKSLVEASERVREGFLSLEMRQTRRGKRNVKRNPSAEEQVAM